MSYLYAPGGTIAKYPYTRDDLTSDNPNISFPSKPRADDLRPFNVYIVAPSPVPILEDPRAQRIERKNPVLDDDRWKEVWEIREATTEEIAAYDLANAPEPEWEQFKLDIMESQSINTAFLSAMTSAPIAASMLTAALANIAAAGGPKDFTTAWSVLLGSGLIAPEVIQEILDLAIASYLPKEFLGGIAGHSS